MGVKIRSCNGDFPSLNFLSKHTDLLLGGQCWGASPLFRKHWPAWEQRLLVNPVKVSLMRRGASICFICATGETIAYIMNVSLHQCLDSTKVWQITTTLVLEGSKWSTQSAQPRKSLEKLHFNIRCTMFRLCLLLTMKFKKKCFLTGYN